MDFARNNLDLETSPYLLQHRDNPVHWQPWGAEALARAGATDKPVLLSVGYAACHWCHVMAHESFENPAIAGVMNALFVNIKVDREERPDIDAIYQTALQLLGERGGWPLTMFLTPAGEPFWGGTYFPASPQYGRPGFADVLARVERAFREDGEGIERNRRALLDALARLSARKPGEAPADDLADRAADALLSRMDMRRGGIGGAPKFPNVPCLELLRRAGRRGRGERFGQAVAVAAEAMAEGGIYDHLGGGWARYSVDAIWLVPHFEKMLYDNAQLLEFYARLWQDDGRDLHRRRAAETVDWLAREMTAPSGAFCSSLDADSDDGAGRSEEGAFYVWTEAEIDAALGDDAPAFKERYGVAPGGNWEGKTVLNRLGRGEAAAEVEARLAVSRARLLEVRAARPRPGLDDKTLADWNGLAIRALARAGAAFQRPDWIAMARRAFEAVAADGGGGDRLRHSARNGRARDVAFLDDYAHMADAALALHEATGERGFLERARAWAARADALYGDEADGGYFFTAAGAEAPIVRTRTALDNAAPSGAGAMVGVLARLWLLTGEAAFRDRAEAAAAAFGRDAEANPAGHATLLLNLDLLRRALAVVIVGERGEAGAEALLAEARRAARGEAVVAVVAPGETLPEGHPAAGKGLVDGRAAAYVCEDRTCSAPATSPQALARLLA